MSAQILDGRKLAQEIKNHLKNEVSELKKSYDLVPKVVNIMVGNDAGACAYATSQRKAAEYIGIDYMLDSLSARIKQEELIEHIHSLNEDINIHGIMIHKPTPKTIDYSCVANHVSTAKDLEGINVANIGKMILGQTKIIPCTPASAMALIKSTKIDLYGKESVIVGHSEIVGKPLSLLLLRELSTVTVCHIATSKVGKLPEHVGRADILVVAVGKAGLIKGDWIKKGAIVIDVGINQVNGRIQGDVEFDGAKQRASFITPVPGGVGPVTVVMLMKNATEAFKAQLNN